MRIRIVLMGVLALAGCRQRGGSTRPDPEAQADAAAPDAVETCTRSCARLDACSEELVADVYGTQETATDPSASTAVLERAFPYDCSSSCTEVGPRVDARIQADCVSLQSCDGFFACATGTPASALLGDAEGDDDVVCEQACSVVAECAQDRAVEQTCMMRCTALDPRDDNGRSDLASCPRDCESLEACYDRWLLGTPAGLTTPPGVSETCDAMCRRGITCGAEDAGLTSAELHEVASTMTDTYVECAVQCQADLRDETQSDYDRCAAQEDCEKFRACAQKL